MTPEYSQQQRFINGLEAMYIERIDDNELTEYRQIMKNFKDKAEHLNYLTDRICHLDEIDRVRMQKQNKLVEKTKRDLQKGKSIEDIFNNKK